jgi:hypothetical protein
MTSKMETPTGIDATAPVVSRHDRVIDAPVDVVWEVHTGIDQWPEWQRDIDSARLSGPLAPGASFTWRTKGIDQPIASTIHAVDPLRRTLLSGPAQGIEGVHEWCFTARGRQTLVQTSESWAGDEVRSRAADLQKVLDESLQRWLGFLATRAEGLAEG